MDYVKEAKNDEKILFPEKHNCLFRKLLIT